MTVVMARTSWTSSPAKAPGELVPSQVLGLAVHHNGPAVPAAAYAGDPAAVRTYLEAVQRQHVVVNGWSDIAYSWAVDGAGRLWELRGWRLRSAANGDWTVNGQYAAVLAILGDGQAPTAGHIAGLRAAVAGFRAVYPRAGRLVGHRDLFATSCPGDQLYALVRSGQLTAPEEDMPLSQQDVDNVAHAVWNLKAPSAFDGKSVSTLDLLRWTNALTGRMQASLAGLPQLVADKLPAQDGLSADQVKAAVVAALAESVVDVRVDVAGKLTDTP